MIAGCFILLYSFSCYFYFVSKYCCVMVMVSSMNITASICPSCNCKVVEDMKSSGVLNVCLMSASLSPLRKFKDEIILLIFT